MTLSPYSSKIYSLIQKKNKKRVVTADSLFENKTNKTSEKISQAIHELQAQGLITIKSILDHGKFATELIPMEGYVQHETIKGKLRADEEDSDEDESPPKRKYQRRNVRRSLI